MADNGALRARITHAAAALEGWDVLLAVSAVMLFAGLALTFDVGIALLVCGVLGLVAGITGARGAELAGAKRKGGGP